MDRWFASASLSATRPSQSVPGYTGGSESTQTPTVGSCGDYTQEKLVPGYGNESTLSTQDQPTCGRHDSWKSEMYPDVSGSSHDQLARDSTVSTIGAFIDNSFRCYMDRSNDTEEIKSVNSALFKLQLIRQNVLRACTSLHDQSIFTCNEYVICPGNQSVELKHGYKPLLNCLVDGIPAESFRFDTHVQRIEWQPNVMMSAESVVDNKDEDKVRVVTATNKVFTADHVIITSSLGYLKAHKNYLFFLCFRKGKSRLSTGWRFALSTKSFLNLTVQLLMIGSGKRHSTCVTFRRRLFPHVWRTSARR